MHALGIARKPGSSQLINIYKRSSVFRNASRVVPVKDEGVFEGS